ncbi:MAG: GNAT family N-acetyltransferase [Acidobacteria bacterium]|nr:GNAT family N-acetyltransferase [Acidobacteriota bacterium]
MPLLTARLRLVPLVPAHLDDLAAMLADPVVMRYFPRVMTRTEASQWLWRTMDRYREHGTGLLAVLRDEGASSAFLGDCGLQIRTFGGATHLELGYHFRREAWGQGYATEAAGACIRLAWRHTDALRIVALIRPENGPSQRVARRVGMLRRGAVLHAGLTHDVWHVARPGPREDTLQ